jgi:molybdenum cofactor cytidylyltransferase
MAGLGAILLAAGRSSRFGDANKLLADIDGRPMVRTVAETLLGADCIAEVLVVTGHDAEAVEKSLGALPVRLVFNPNWADGMAGSIARGVAELSADPDGVAIVPGDMPFLTASLIETLGARFKERDAAAIVFPATQFGEQRNPVIWPRRYFGLLEGLSGPHGAKHLLSELTDACIAVPIHDEATLRDVDAIDDLS